MANDEPDKTEELTDAELDAVNGGLKVDMKDLLITSYDTSGSTTEAKHEFREHVAFTYQKIEPTDG